MNFKYLHGEAHKNGVPLPAVQFVILCEHLYHYDTDTGRNTVIFNNA